MDPHKFEQEAFSKNEGAKTLPAGPKVVLKENTDPMRGENERFFD